jgi:hypothetical protein
MKISLCMLISNQTFRFARFALESAMAHYRPHEVLLGIAPGLSYQREIEDLAKSLSGGRLRVMEGTWKRNDVARARFGMFDKATGDWLMVVDDDDAVIGTLDIVGRIDQVDPSVGFIHTDILATCMEDTGSFRKAGDLFIRTSKPITRRRDANWFRGSHYFYRAAAWRDVSDLVDRSTIDYEEWRVAWHMMNTGWSGHHEPRILQVQRCRDYVAAAEHQQITRGITWEKVEAGLRAKHGSDT